MFNQNASKCAIFHIGIQKPKVTFSIFHFVLLYFFPNEYLVYVDISSSTNSEIGRSDICEMPYYSLIWEGCLIYYITRYFIVVLLFEIIWPDWMKPMKPIPQDHSCPFIQTRKDLVIYMIRLRPVRWQKHYFFPIRIYRYY